ncbi:MAG: hypothetical protein GX493_02200 [Firmicutes bacterium]|nr:hypothetical protein [Bacillota bacterium]
MDRYYLVDLAALRAEGRDLLTGLRAAVGRAKRLAGGGVCLKGIALGRRGERVVFCFRLGRP